MIHRKLWSLVALLLAAVAFTPAQAAILVNLEDPPTNKTVSGIGLIGGWALADNGVEKVEYYIDGTLTGVIAYGGTRADVEAVHPGYPDSSAAGFSKKYNFNKLSPGSHTVEVKVYEEGGGTATKSASITTTRFGSDTYFSNDDFGEVKAFHIPFVYPDSSSEQHYQVWLEWSQNTQQYMIRGIEDKGDDLWLCILTPAPSGLTVSKSSGNAALSWTDNSTSEHGFRIERRFVGALVTSDWEVLTIVDKNTTSYTDTTVDLTTSLIVGTGDYEYRVQAYHIKTDCTSSYSNTDSVSVEYEPIIVLP